MGPNDVMALTWCCPRCGGVLFIGKKDQNGKECCRCGHKDVDGEGNCFQGVPSF